jgi:hypothetical protein
LDASLHLIEKTRDKLGNHKQGAIIENTAGGMNGGCGHCGAFLCILSDAVHSLHPAEYAFGDKYTCELQRRN